MTESVPCMISESRDCGVIQSDKLVFIIGPGSREFSEDIGKIVEVVKNFGFEPYFALLSEEEKGLDAFCDKICSKIRGSVFCIVLLNNPILNQQVENLTKVTEIIRAPRANVYYEFGVAVAFGKKVIPVIKKNMELPFDIQHLDTVLYEDVADLEQKLRNSIRAILVKGIKSKPPIKTPKLELSLLDAEGNATNAITAEPVITKIKYVAEKEVPSSEQNYYKSLEKVAAVVKMWNTSFGSKTPDKDLVPIGIRIWNEGGVPAENVLINVYFPETASLFDKSEVEGSLAILKPGPKTQGGLYVRNKSKTVASAWVDHLGNDRGASFEKIFARFNIEKEQSYEVYATVVQDNYPKNEFTFKINVKPKIVTETRVKET